MPTTLIVIAILGITSGVIQHRIKVQTQQEVRQSLSAVLDTSHQSLRLWFEEQEANAALWGASREVRQPTLDLLGAPQDIMSLIVSHAQSQLRVWLDRISEHYGYRAYSVVDVNNINISASRNRDIGRKSLAAAQPGFLARVWAGETVMSLPQKLDAPLGNQDGAGPDRVPTILVGTPIRDTSDRVIAALVFHLDPAHEFAAILQRGWFGTSGETYAFDSSGRLLSNSRFDDQLHDYGLVPGGEKGMLNIDIREFAVNLTQSDEVRMSYAHLPLTYMASRATSGEAGVSVEPYRDYRGKMVVGAWLWDPEHGLGLATELDASEAYQTLQLTRVLVSVLTLLVAVLLLGRAAFSMVNVKRRQAEDLARESDRRLARFFYAAFEKIFFVDQGKIVDVNPAAVEALGYKYDQIVGRNLLELVVPGQRKDIAQQMELNSFGPYEADITTEDGKKIQAEVRAKVVEQEGVPLRVVGMRDITERRRAEDALARAYGELEERVIERTCELEKANRDLQWEIGERQQAEDQLRKLSRAVYQSPASILITDLEGKIEYVNPKFSEVTGYTFDEAVGQKPSILHSGHQTREFYQELWRTIAAGSEWNGELLNKKKCGELFWENASISPVVNEHGKITNFIGVKEDITARKKADAQVQQLLQQNRALTQRLFETQEMERRHLARELHDEFGQWLTAIRLHSQVIAELAEDKEQSTIYRSAKTINQSADQMSRAARKIMHELRPQLLDDSGLGASLRELVNQWQSRNPDVVCELENPCKLNHRCILDRLDDKVAITLYRVVQESLTNAAKYARAKRISIRLRCRSTSRSAPAALVLEIADNGIGLDKSVTSKGVGLVWMRERVLAAGGQFFLDGRPGEGVSILVKFPMRLGEDVCNEKG